jgi:hypothetical protein
MLKNKNKKCIRVLYFWFDDDGMGREIFSREMMGETGR